MRYLVLALLSFLTLAGPARAGEPQRVRLSAFGNSLVNHAEGGAETNVPVWLARMARADGALFSMDGQYGFLKDFAATLPPEPSWNVRGVRGAWIPGRRSFGEAGFTHALITPANFIQYRAPDQSFEDGKGEDATPLSVTLRLIDWLHENSPKTRIVLYEGWADMAPFADPFPPSARALRKYQAFNSGEYHDWYATWLAELRAARPDARITLAPVARVLAGLLSDGPLAELPAEALYSDNAPHGTPTLYLLAAMVTYASLNDRSPPEALRLSDAIDPVLRENYRATAARIWQMVSAQDTAAAAAPAPAPAAPAPAASSAAPPEPAPRPARLAVLEEALDTGHTNPALAMGLNGLSDWSVQHPFVNIFKTARGWIGHRDGEWGAWRQDDLIALGLLNADGWPTALPEGATQLEALILTDQPPETKAELAGRYRVTWKGAGTLRILGRVRKVSIGDHEAWFSFTPGDGGAAIAILETDPRGIGDIIRDIAVVREEQIPLYDAGAVFNPDWLAVINDLRAIRFMDWMQTNNSP
ncbi:MAG TPA: calcium-binding protein, partial [Aliiroseovarius sp.]|nr:calcium-binding protein [Aliiroseovarius sp.]